MGLDVYLYRYTGERTLEEDDTEFSEHSEAMNEIYTKARLEVAGEPVKVVEEGLFGPHEKTKSLEPDQYDAVKRLVKARQIHYIEQNNLHFHMGEYGPEISEEKIEIDSAKYPEHMFKIGYMRSSYNAGGFNSVVSELTGHDLYWLFGVDSVDNYYVRPDWKTALVRVGALIDQLAMDPGYIVARMDTSHGPAAIASILTGRSEHIGERVSLKQFMELKKTVDVFDDASPFALEGFFFWPTGVNLLAVVRTSEGPVVLLEGKEGVVAHKPPSEEAVAEAMKVWDEQVKNYEENNRPKDGSMWDMSSYSCREGHFYMKGMEVRAVTKSHSYSGPCLDFICLDPNNSEWYLHAAEIVKEMIEWVLAQPNPDEYYFHWSG